jgi:hypothetical protein
MYTTSLLPCALQGEAGIHLMLSQCITHVEHQHQGAAAPQSSVSLYCLS